MTSLSWSKFRERLSLQAEAKGIPISGIFELTARCNLKCKMCYLCRHAGDKLAMSRERSTAEWIQLAKESRDAGMLYILLTGGEVFLRRDFREIYEEISNMGLVPTIYTNATLVTSEIVDWISRTPPEKIEVTIYGSSPLTYQKVSGCADGYEKAVKGIDALLNAGINLRLKTTVIPDNEADYNDLIQFAEDRELALKFCFYISPRRSSSGMIQDVSRLEPQALAGYLYRASNDFCNKHQQNLGDSQQEGTPHAPGLDEIEDMSPFKCSAGKRDFWITWDGLMTPCGLLGEPHTFPLENGFQAAWKELRQLLTSVPVCDKCKTCSLRENCLTCPARLKNETGHFDRPADYLCELARHQQLLYGKKQ